MTDAPQRAGDDALNVASECRVGLGRVEARGRNPGGGWIELKEARLQAVPGYSSQAPAALQSAHDDHEATHRHHRAR